MSDPAAGFGNADDRNGETSGSGAEDPFGPLGDPQQMAAMLRQFADAMSWEGGPVNWDLAKNVARQTVVAEGDPTVTEAERGAVAEALRLADLWLSETTVLPSGVIVGQAWSRSEWIEQTMPVWSKLIEPIAVRMVDALDAAIPEQMRQTVGPLIGMVRQIGGMMVGGQTGQAVGALAKEVVGSSDVGLPLSDHAALVPANVARYGEGLQLPAEEVRLYLSLREAAHQRLFQHVPWLSAHLLGAVEEYAQGITVDVSQLEETLAQLDLSETQALQEALSSGQLWQPEESERQKAALTRLETALTLVEGWVATVVDAAAAHRLPAAPALAETVRRRRASGGPAERTFASLVGLELRPRRTREAAALWQALAEKRGLDGRDAVWAHPDLMPSAGDLDNPDGFLRQEQDFDTTALTDSAEDDESDGSG